MTKTVEFFYDFGSPTVYLAATQLPAVADQAGAIIDWRPMLLGGVFKSTGNQSPVVVPAKAAYMNVDLERFAERPIDLVVRRAMRPRIRQRAEADMADEVEIDSIL